MKASPISVWFVYAPMTKSERTGQSCACSGTLAWLRSTTLRTQAPSNVNNIGLRRDDHCRYQPVKIGRQAGGPVTLNPSNTDAGCSVKNAAVSDSVAAMSESHVTIAIGAEVFSARLRDDLAPHSCRQLKAILPYQGTVIHARWSGEAVWSRLGAAWPGGVTLPPENATANPKPGNVLLYAGALSEPELLFVYGTCRFACNAGPLEGNPVLTIEGDLTRLADVGRKILEQGVLPLRVALSPRASKSEEP
jgi:hypothetical protein